MKKLLFVLAVLFSASLAYAQAAPDPAPPAVGWEFLSLLVSGGLVTALLQLFRRINLLSLIPSWLRPVLAGLIGTGIASLTAYLLTNFGIDLDLSAIVAFFATGGAATGMFAMGKELGVLNSTG